jgi:hypothetical protein
MATVNLPSFLAMPSGHMLLDVMPCVSLAACLPTLYIFRQHRRIADLAVYSLGFFLALVYHICHMHSQGIANAMWLGIDGPTWRTLDILCCQLMLARTVGHACGDDHPMIHGEISKVLQISTSIWWSIHYRSSLAGISTQ